MPLWDSEVQNTYTTFSIGYLSSQFSWSSGVFIRHWRVGGLVNSLLEADIWIWSLTRLLVHSKSTCKGQFEIHSSTSAWGGSAYSVLGRLYQQLQQAWEQFWWAFFWWAFCPTAAWVGKGRKSHCHFLFITSKGKKNSRTSHTMASHGN